MMQIEVVSIQEIDLPNYLETISGGGNSRTQEAPLLMKYRVHLRTSLEHEMLYFEVRSQPREPLIDEYYEGQVYNAIYGLLSEIKIETDRKKSLDEVRARITEWVYETYRGKTQIFPLRYEVD